MSSNNAEENQRDIFLSIVSHELKTPITSIQGFSQAMQRKMQRKLQQYKPNDLFSREEIERFNENFETILRQIKKMNRLIDDLLDISVIEQGTLPHTFTPVDILKVLKEVCERIQEHSSHHRIRLQLPLEGDCTIYGDDTKLDQLFSNVIGNAVKFSPHSEIISVTLDKEDTKCTIHVQDSGMGIPEDDLPHVFDLYYRGKSIGSTKMSGLGLGLYLSKKIVDIHHGKIGVQSIVEKGTTVSIELPKYTL